MLSCSKLYLHVCTFTPWFPSTWIPLCFVMKRRHQCRVVSKRLREPSITNFQSLFLQSVPYSLKYESYLNAFNIGEFTAIKHNHLSIWFSRTWHSMEGMATSSWLAAGLCLLSNTLCSTYSFSRSWAVHWALKPSFSSTSRTFWARSRMFRLSLLYLTHGGWDKCAVSCTGHMLYLTQVYC